MTPKKFSSKFSLLILFSLLFAGTGYTFAATTTHSNNSDEITIQDNTPQFESIIQSNLADQVRISLNGSFFNLTQQKQLADIQQQAISSVEFHTGLWRYTKRYKQLLTQAGRSQMKLTDGVKTSPLNTQNSQVAFTLPKLEKSYLVLNYQAQSLALNNLILVLPLSADKSTLSAQQLENYRTLSQTVIMALSRGIAKESADIITKDLWHNEALYQRFNGKYRWLNTSCDYNATLQNRICIFYKKN